MLTMSSIGYNGRLGNQMFQLACLISLSEKTGIPFFLPEENFTTNNEHGYNDGSQLRDCFNLPDAWFKPKNLIRENINYHYKEPHFHFTEEIFKLPSGTDIWGYFQSERYFSGCSGRIRKIFDFKDPIKEEASKIIDGLMISENYICAHIRRGDYLNQSWNHPVLSEQYYIESAKEIGGKVFFFSDDPDWCKAEISTRIEGSEVVDVKNPFVSLCAMSRFKKFIIGNSSFSWWAAWLADKPSVVIAPSIWFGTKLFHETKDVYCEGWIKR